MGITRSDELRLSTAIIIRLLNNTLFSTPCSLKLSIFFFKIKYHDIYVTLD
jgi:hypothetical protein